ARPSAGCGAPPAARPSAACSAARARRGAARAPSGRRLPVRGAVARVLLGGAGAEPAPPALHGAPVGHHVRLPGVPARPRRRGAPRDGAPPPPARGLAPGCRGPRLSARPAWLARAVRAPMDAATMSRVDEPTLATLGIA